MENDKTLFHYLYTTLTKQITTGVLHYGEKLPSMRRLCGLYQVGIRTVRDVLQALKENGYVESTARVGYRVAYRGDHHDKDIVHAVLSKWDATFDTVKMVLYFFPDMIEAAAPHCPECNVKQWLASIQEDTEQSALPNPDLSYAIISQIVTIYGNPVLNDLLAEISQFTKMPAVCEIDPSPQISGILSRHVAEIVNFMYLRDYYKISLAAEKMFSEVAFVLTQTFESILSMAPGFSDFHSTQFDWQLQKRRQYRYMEVADSIIQKLGKNNYPGQSLLPSVTSLSEEYGVSIYTINLALGALSELGIVTTVSRKGIRFTPGKNASIKMTSLNKAIQGEIRQFVWALHICCLVIEKYSSGLFSLLHESWQTEARENIAALSDYFEFFLALDEKSGMYEAARTIGRELSGTMVWEYYFKINWPGRYKTVGSYIEDSLQALAENDRDAFSGALTNAYQAMFDMAQDLTGETLSV